MLQAPNVSLDKMMSAMVGCAGICTFKLDGATVRLCKAALRVWQGCTQVA